MEIEEIFDNDDDNDDHQTNADFPQPSEHDILLTKMGASTKVKQFFCFLFSNPTDSLVQSYFSAAMADPQTLVSFLMSIQLDPSVDDDTMSNYIESLCSRMNIAANEAGQMRERYFQHETEVSAAFNEVLLRIFIEKQQAYHDEAQKKIHELDATEMLNIMTNSLPRAEVAKKHHTISTMEQ
jgi:hypothetical protein